MQIEDIKEHEMSMYKVFTEAEIIEKRKRLSEFEAKNND